MITPLVTTCGCSPISDHAEITRCEHRVSRYDGYDSTKGFDAPLTLTDTLGHLPGSKRRAADDLCRGQAVRSTNLSARKAGGKILKIMLFGSYAHGDWPKARRRFELLSRAYVEARYSPNYAITREELGWLLERVQLLQTTVATICEERVLGLPLGEGDGALPKN